MAEHATKHEVQTCAEHAEITTGKPLLACQECGSIFIRNNGSWTRYRPEGWVTDQIANIPAGPKGDTGDPGPSISTNAFGYGTGAGGAVTQATSKSTAVTLNKLCGRITMHGAALAAGAIVSFTLTNSNIGVNDVLVLNHVSGGTAGPYLLNAQPANGSAVINVRNTSAGSLSQAIVIGFVVIKGAVS